MGQAMESSLNPQINTEDQSFQLLAGQVEGLWILTQGAQDRCGLLTRAEHKDNFQEFIPEQPADGIELQDCKILVHTYIPQPLEIEISKT